MAEQNYPLLLPTPSSADRDPGHGGGPRIHRPPIEHQSARISPKFTTLNQAFEARRLSLQQLAPGENPELVLVLETIGAVDDFAKAVAKVPALEWLVEWEEDDIPPDDDFYELDKHGNKREKSLSGRLFLLGSNREALDQLLALWNRYQANPTAKFDRGLAPFRHVFSRLKDIRPWSVQDRVGKDVREYWQERLDENAPLIRFEIEAWFSAAPGKNEIARAQITNRVNQLGGKVLSHVLLTEIAYHGFLVELPGAALAAILGGETPELVLLDRISSSGPRRNQ